MKSPCPKTLHEKSDLIRYYSKHFHEIVTAHAKD